MADPLVTAHKTSQMRNGEHSNAVSAIETNSYNKLKALLTENGVNNLNIAQVLIAELKDSQMLSAFISSTREMSQIISPTQDFHKSSLNALKGEGTDAQVEHLRIAASQFREHIEHKVKEQEYKVKPLEDAVNSLEKQVSDIVSGIDASRYNQGTPNTKNQELAQKSSQEKTNFQAEVKSEFTKPNQTVQSSLELTTTVIASGKVVLHQRNQDGSLAKINRTLLLNSDGELLENGTSAKGLRAVYLNEGQAYLADGRKLNSLEWGNISLSAKNLGAYLEPLKDGKFSSVKDGYLKDLRVDGVQAVFTNGLPPALLQKSKIKSEKLEKHDSQQQKSTIESPEIKLKKHAEVKELELPKAPSANPSQAKNPDRRVSFQTNINGINYSQDSRLRIATDGTLQMLFGKEPNTQWLDPSNAKERSCICLYQQEDGRLLDAQGNVVKRLQWDKCMYDASIVSKYIEPTKEGEISTVKKGFLNALWYNGKRVVFTAGMPPQLHPSTEVTNATQENSKPKTHRSYPTDISRIDVSVRQNNQGYFGRSLDFRRNELGELELRKDKSDSWHSGANSSIKVGQKEVQFELLYRNEGKVYDSKGNIIESLKYGEAEIKASQFEQKIFQYTSSRNDRGIYAMPNHILNDIRYGNKHVVFVNEAPPLK